MNSNDKYQKILEEFYGVQEKFHKEMDAVSKTLTEIRSMVPSEYKEKIATFIDLSNNLKDNPFSENPIKIKQTYSEEDFQKIVAHLSSVINPENKSFQKLFAGYAKYTLYYEDLRQLLSKMLNDNRISDSAYNKIDDLKTSEIIKPVQNAGRYHLLLENIKKQAERDSHPSSHKQSEQYKNLYQIAYQKSQEVNNSLDRSIKISEFKKIYSGEGKPDDLKVVGKRVMDLLASAIISNDLDAIKMTANAFDEVKNPKNKFLNHHANEKKEIGSLQAVCKILIENANGLRHLQDIFNKKELTQAIKKDNKVEQIFHSLENTLEERRQQTISQNLTAKNRQIFSNGHLVDTGMYTKLPDKEFVILTNASNELTRSIASEILNTNSTADKNKVINRWVGVMKKCFDEKNFHSVIAITDTFKMPEIKNHLNATVKFQLESTQAKINNMNRSSLSSQNFFNHSKRASQSDKKEEAKEVESKLSSHHKR